MFNYSDILSNPFRIEYESLLDTVDWTLFSKENVKLPKLLAGSFLFSDNERKLLCSTKLIPYFYEPFQKYPKFSTFSLPFAADLLLQLRTFAVALLLRDEEGVGSR